MHTTSDQVIANGSSLEGTDFLRSSPAASLISWLWQMYVHSDMHEQLMDFVLPTVAVLVLLFWMRGRWSGSHPAGDKSPDDDGGSATVDEIGQDDSDDDDEVESNQQTSDNVPDDESISNRKMKVKKKKKKKEKKKTNQSTLDDDEDDDWAPVRIGRSKLHPIASFRDRTGHQMLLESGNGGGDPPWTHKRQSVSVGPIMLTHHQDIIINQCDDDDDDNDENGAEDDTADAGEADELQLSTSDSKAAEKSSTESPIYVCV